MHSSVTDRDKQTWKNNQRPANSQIYKDTQLNNINRGFTIIEYKFVMRIFFQCEELQKSDMEYVYETTQALSVGDVTFDTA